MSHIIKGNADISNLDVSNTAKIRGKNVTTSVNGVVADALGRIIIEVGFPKDSLDVIKNGNILSNFYNEGFYELKIDDISTVIDFPSENIKGTGIMFVYILDNVKYQYIIDEECNTAIRKDLESQWFTNINTETVFEELKKYVLVTEFNKKISEIQTELKKLENNKFNTSNVVHDITKNTKSTVPSSFATFNLLKDSFRKLGDIGSKNLNEFKYIDENSDLGMYIQSDDELATTENNYPFKKKGILMIYPNGIAGTQIYYPNNEPFYYKRDSISIDEFGVWVKFGIEYSTDPNIIAELNKKIDKEEALNSFVGIGMYENAFGSNISDINLDINNAKTNKTFFVYGQHTNNIPDNITGSGLTFSGFYTDKNMSNSYSIQLVGAYSVDDMMLFRTYNGDKKIWNNWRQFASVEYIKEFAQNGDSELHLSSKNGKNSFIFHRDSDQTFGLWSNIEKKSIFRVDGKGKLYSGSSGEFDGELFAKGRIQINSGVDEYTKFALIKPNKKYVILETKPDEHNAFASIYLSNADNSVDTNFLFNKEGGTKNIATREWVDNKYYKRGDSPSFKYYIDVYHNTDSTRRMQLSYELNNDVLWTIKDGTSTIAVKHPRERGTLATREWCNSSYYNTSQTDARYVRSDTTNLGKQYTPAETIASGKWARPIGFSTMTHPNTPNKPAGITGYGFWHVIAGRDQGNGYAGFFTEYGGGRVFYGRGDTSGVNPSWYKVYTEASKPTPDEIDAVNLGKGGNIRLHSYGSGKHGYSSWYENNARQAYIGYGSDGTVEFSINNEKSNGTINLRAKDVQSNGSTIATEPWVISNFYKKSETYTRGEVDSRVNGRLTQAQGDTRYFSKNGGTINGGTTVSGNFTSTGNIQGNVFLQPVQSGSWISLKTSRCYTQSGTVASGNAAPALRQEHVDRFYMLAGLGNSQFGIYMINKSTTNNQTDGGAYLNQSGDWVGNRNGSFIDVEIRSDIRSKDNIKLITSPLEKINQISGYTYNVYTDNKQNSQKSAGVIAQEVIKVLPEIVRHDDDTDLYKVTYNGITALLVESVKELSEKVKHLEGIIKNKGY